MLSTLHSGTYAMADADIGHVRLVRCMQRLLNTCRHDVDEHKPTLGITHSSRDVGEYKDYGKESTCWSTRFTRILVMVKIIGD